MTARDGAGDDSFDSVIEGEGGKHLFRVTKLVFGQLCVQASILITAAFNPSAIGIMNEWRTVLGLLLFFTAAFACSNRTEDKKEARMLWLAMLILGCIVTGVMFIPALAPLKIMPCIKAFASCCVGVPGLAALAVSSKTPILRDHFSSMLIFLTALILYFAVRPDMAYWRFGKQVFLIGVLLIMLSVALAIDIQQIKNLNAKEITLYVGYAYQVNLYGLFIFYLLYLAFSGGKQELSS